MIKKLTFIAWIALVGLITSCDGDKGDVGPAGPAGPKGETGAPGKDGVNGEDGVGAKEIVAGAVKTTKGGYTLGKANLTQADTAMVNKSVVVLFIKSKDLWWAQPGKVEFADNQWTQFNFVTLLRGTTLFVDIRPVAWSEQQETAPERDLQGIRAVIIPAEKLRLNAEVDLTNYDEVVSKLGIKESDILEADI
ncbi:hypothetical protein SAMN05216327_108241 [Dyadobacter sp. SG02]|uniref:collagen-like protein n=1 Tax=Dyadobacter sp. SG02 TaxID=1855291 RepID=UPI0008AC6199|nr:collagen-like protein [Dyadobacter sp. SG02]SEJ31785.1 hypothetical protein SAMN05216327_108241 [Dyadobacter sp. SG02]